jgi:hypothetical protein
MPLALLLCLQDTMHLDHNTLANHTTMHIQSKEIYLPIVQKYPILECGHSNQSDQKQY